MNTKKQEIELTKEEKDLIEMIRNYNASYPNGYPNMLIALYEQFESLIRQPN